MKKKIYTCVLLILTVIFLTGCSKKKSAWLTDYDAAVKLAEKNNKSLLVLFSGDDWDEISALLKSEVLEKKEFVDAVKNDFVLVNIDFSQVEYQQIFAVTDESSQKERDAAEKIRIAYEKKENIAQAYNLSAYPSIYASTVKGYIAREITVNQDNPTEGNYIEQIAEALPVVQKLNELTKTLEAATGTDRIKIIDDLYETIPTGFRNCLGTLIREIPALDKDNTTGLLGKYELQVAYLDAIDKAVLQDVEGAVKIFVDAAEKGHLSGIEKQEALYNAAYLLTSLQELDYDRMINLLEKSYNVAPDSPMADTVVKSIAQLKQLKEYGELKPEQENSPSPEVEK